MIDCRRVPSTQGNGDLCRFTANVTSRPTNKTEAVADAVVGGTMVSTTGAAAATQVGMRKINLLYFRFFVCNHLCY